MARREAVGGVDLAFIEHDIEGLRRGEPSRGHAGRRPGVHAKQAAMAQVLNPADVPGNFIGLDGAELL